MRKRLTELVIGLFFALSILLITLNSSIQVPFIYQGF